MNHYSWLEDRKRQAVAEKGNGRVAPSLAQVPLRMRYMGNTGNGEDGELQPFNPTDMISTSRGRRMVHEGEDVYSNGRATTVVPANMSQRQLRQMEEKENIPGYSYGGTFMKSFGVKEAADWFTGKTAKAENPAATTVTMKPIAAQQTAAPAPMKLPEMPLQIKEPPTVTMKPVAAPPPTPAPAPLKLPEMNAPTQTIAPKAAQPLAPPPPLTISPESEKTLRQVQGVPEPVTKIDEQSYRTSAMGRLASQARGSNPAYDSASQKALDDLKATQAVEHQVAAQQAAQTGLNPQAAAARQAMDRAAGRSALADAEGQMVVGKMEAQDRANAELANQSMTGMQFDESKRLNDRNFNRNIVESDRQFTQGKLETDRQFELTKQRYGDEETNRLSNDIGTGATIETVNSQRASRGLPPISQQEYDSIQAAGPIGTTKYDRGLKAVSTLLATPGAANKQQAATMLNDLFPGMNIDFSQVIKDENYQQFGDGLASMSDYVAAGMSFDDALVAMEKDGTFASMGIGKAEAEKLYKGMKVNAIDAQWEAISGSKTYMSLDEDRKASVKDFFTASLTGELEWDIKTQYDVLDNSGKVVKTFLDEKDALAYSTGKDGYTVKNTGKTQIVPKNITDGADLNSADQDRSSGSLKEQFDAFNETVPGEVWTYEKWVSEQKPTSFDRWSKPNTTQQSSEISDLFTTSKGKLTFDSSKSPPALAQTIASEIEKGDTDVQSKFGVSSAYAPAFFENGAKLVSGGQISGKSTDYLNLGMTTSQLQDQVGKVALYKKPDGTTGKLVIADVVPPMSGTGSPVSKDDKIGSNIGSNEFNKPIVYVYDVDSKQISRYFVYA